MATEDDRRMPMGPVVERAVVVPEKAAVTHVSVRLERDTQAALSAYAVFHGLALGEAASQVLNEWARADTETVRSILRKAGYDEHDPETRLAARLVLDRFDPRIAAAFEERTTS